MSQKKIAKKGGGINFSHLNAFHLGGIERKIDAGEYVDGTELGSALREHGQQPIPPKVLEYLCRFLEGQLKKPRGPKPLAAPLRAAHCWPQCIQRTEESLRLGQDQWRHGLSLSLQA